MSKLNAIVIATTLLFAAAAQADDSAARAAQELTAQAMRTEGVDHLIPAPRSNSEAQPATARAKTVKPLQQATEQAAPKAKAETAKPVAASQASLSRAAVVAELQRARQAGELDHAFAEIGYQPLPVAVGRVSDETRVAAR